MNYEIIILDDKDFIKHLLIHCVGAIELFNQKAISGQDLWRTICPFYPNGKIEGYRTPKHIDHILGLMSELEWARDDFPRIYLKSLRKLRSLLKREVSKLGYTRYDPQGNFIEEILRIKVTRESGDGSCTPDVSNSENALCDCSEFSIE